MRITESRIRQIIREEARRAFRDDLDEGFLEKGLDFIGRKNPFGRTVKERAQDLLRLPNIDKIVMNPDRDIARLKAITKMGDNEAAEELSFIQSVENHSKDFTSREMKNFRDKQDREREADARMRGEEELKRKREREDRDRESIERAKRAAAMERVPVGENPDTGEVEYVTRAAYDRGERRGQEARYFERRHR
jgi:hypothetical protein